MLLGSAALHILIHYPFPFVWTTLLSYDVIVDSCILASSRYTQINKWLMLLGFQTPRVKCRTFIEPCILLLLALRFTACYRSSDSLQYLNYKRKLTLSSHFYIDPAKWHEYSTWGWKSQFSIAIWKRINLVLAQYRGYSLFSSVAFIVLISYPGEIASPASSDIPDWLATCLAEGGQDA